MGKKKADFEADRDAYHQHHVAIQAAMTGGFYRDAVKHAVAALPFVDGMMEYARRWEDAVFKSVGAIDTILRYAPLVFDRKSLISLDQLLSSQKRIDRNATDDLAIRLQTANSELWLNHRLWTHLEDGGQVRQDELRQMLGGDQDYWRWACEIWERMGLLRRQPSRNSYVVSLHTRIGEVVTAKCDQCGKPQEAPKAMFFELLVCPECQRSATFVIL